MILCGYNVDTLNICMKEFIIFVCTDSTEIFLSKLRSLVRTITCQVFSLTLTVRGVSNKHCLLTFFIVVDFRGMVDKRHFVVVVVYFRGMVDK